MQVLVLERNPRRPGAELSSDQLTLPNFVHDLGSGFFPFARTSPALVELQLEQQRLSWLHAEVESCHLASDGSRVCLHRNPEARGMPFGSGRDQETWTALARHHARIEPDLYELLLRPAPTWAAAYRVGAQNLLAAVRTFTTSSHRLAARLFESDDAARVIPTLAAVLGAVPSRMGSGGYGYLMALAATTGGFAVPRGGAQSVANALVSVLERHGGRLRLASKVGQVVTSRGETVAVTLSGGEEIVARRGILADMNPTELRGLLRPSDRHASKRQAAEGTRGATGTFKIDWALSGPMPWRVEEARRSTVVTTTESVAALLRSQRRLRRGELPDPPCVTFVQPTLADPSRAPRNQHTLGGLVPVPLWPRERWQEDQQQFADSIEAQTETLAPGFRRRILERHLAPPLDGAAGDGPSRVASSPVRGLLGGALRRCLSPGSPYRTGVARLYLCSSATHPGPGLHGMSGHNAASVALRDFG